MGKILTTILDMYLNGRVGEISAEILTALGGETRAQADRLDEMRRKLTNAVRDLDTSKALCGNLRDEILDLVATYQTEIGHLDDKLAEESRKHSTLAWTAACDERDEATAKCRLLSQASDADDRTIEALRANLETARKGAAMAKNTVFDMCREGEELHRTIEALRDELGAARAERDHALEGLPSQVTLGEDVIFSIATEDGRVSTSPDGINWATRQIEEPGYDELGAALTERDEALESVGRLEDLLTDAVRERDEAITEHNEEAKRNANLEYNLEREKTERDEARGERDAARSQVGHLADACALDEVQDLKNQIRELVDSDMSAQGALLLARGGLRKAKEVAKASEDVLKAFFALEVTSDEHGQRPVYPVSGDLYGRFRKVAAMAEALRMGK